MKRIPLTKSKFALVDDEDYDELSKYRWHTHSSGYAVRKKHINGKNISVYMHRILSGAGPNQYTDHINNKPYDNRRINLRVCSNYQNSLNHGPKSNNLSGYKGVSRLGYRKYSKNKWKAEIFYKNKKIHLGCFVKRIDAAIAYNNAAKDLFGKYAWLNKV